MRRKVANEREGREFWAKARMRVLKRWAVGSGTRSKIAAEEDGRRQREYEAMSFEAMWGFVWR